MAIFKIITSAAVVALLTATSAVHAQQDASHSEHALAETDAEGMQKQLAEMRAQVARLEAALAVAHAAGSTAAAHNTDTPAAAMSGKGMGMGMGKAKAKGMGMGKGVEKGMGMGGTAAMPGGNKGDMKRMQMMGRMRGMPDDSFLTSLPGFPGTSHIYHVGATGHFLDHADHLDLSMAQHKELAEIHEADLLEQATFDRRVEEAEQALWTLTSSDAPDATAIEKKVHEIADLQSKQRLSFIRSVGRAAEVLNDEQLGLLAGHEPGDSGSQDSSAHDH